MRVLVEDFRLGLEVHDLEPERVPGSHARVPGRIGVRVLKRRDPVRHLVLSGAARPQSLVGKTLYLVDCLFDNSEAFMDQLKRWFAEHLPSVDTRMIKPRESWVDDPAMRQKIAADGHAAVLGVGL